VNDSRHDHQDAILKESVKILRKRGSTTEVASYLRLSIRGFHRPENKGKMRHDRSVIKKGKA